MLLPLLLLAGLVFIKPIWAKMLFIAGIVVYATLVLIGLSETPYHLQNKLLAHELKM